MKSDEDKNPRNEQGWRCANLWAKTEAFEGNPVKQLLIPAGVFTRVEGAEGALQVKNVYGTWPAAGRESPLSQDRVWAKLPVGSKPGDPISTAEWSKPKSFSRVDPGKVLESYQAAITFSVRHLAYVSHS